MELEKKFYDAGGLLVAGTDPTGFGGVVAGYSNHRQIELLFEAGFTMPEIVKVCTYNGAVLLGIEKKKGSIEEGKDADLLILDGDLDSNVHVINKSETVYKGGVAYDSKSLFELAKGRVGMH